MTTINGIPYYEADFTEDGSPGPASGADDLRAAVNAGGITDVFVLSHGWNNGVDSARDLYQAMFTLLAEQLGDRRTHCAGVGVLWPSLLFPDDDPATAPAVPSTGAQLAAALAPAFPAQQQQLAAMGTLLDQQPAQPEKFDEFHSLAIGLVTTPGQSGEDENQAAALTADAHTMFSSFATLAPAPADDAQSIPDLLSSLWSGAREALRGMSYYEMKNRAGVVGINGLGPLLGSLNGVRIHLMGHSFGARLVSYALSGLPDSATGPASPVKSLTLIQGAFSHFTFASSLPFDGSRGGGLAGLGSRVDGPMLATFTAADRAVGWWYPAASRLARQDSQSDDDFDYRWGAMGHDGYQQNPAAVAVPMAEPGKPYGFASGTAYSLDANDVIKAMQSQFSGAHSDIRHPEVLWAVVCAANLS